jgi:hypothetical protein
MADTVQKATVTEYVPRLVGQELKLCRPRGQRLKLDFGWDSTVQTPWRGEGQCLVRSWVDMKRSGNGDFIGAQIIAHGFSGALDGAMSSNPGRFAEQTTFRIS